MLLALTITAGVAAAAWTGLLLHPARPWDLRPRDDGPESPVPDRWPSVAIVVPAHDEAAIVHATLPTVLAQDYPGLWRVVVVDDRSTDGTGARVREIAAGRAEVIDGAALPAGWMGKVWAMAQGIAHVERTGDVELVLLTDADIAHAPGSLRRLVADLLHHGVVLDSRMALLRTVTAPERLLIPAFAFFFACLYPMRWVGRGGRRAAAAGGCVLVRRSVLAEAGGMAAIRGEIIDDVNLAQTVARHGRVRLAASCGDVRSLRAYDTVGAVWRMVRRTAFDQLGYSWPLLVLTVVGLAVLFLGPPVALIGGATTGAAVPAALGGAAWAVLTAVYLPAVRQFRLAPLWALGLPVAGVLYGCMTVDSALRQTRGRGGAW